MFQTNLYCYLWDLVDEGIDEVLDRIKGETGITSMTVAVHHPAIDQLRPHEAASPRRFRSAGGAQFQPDTARYTSTRMRPIVADWLHKSKRNPLTKIADACDQRGLSLRAWVVCCDSAVLATRYPTSCTKDILDQPSASRLCPINLDVREYLASLIEDLSETYPFETIELEQLAFPTDLQSPSPGIIGLERGETGDWLGSLCFCESCRQMAARDGIDVDAVADVAREHLEHILATGEPLTLPITEFVEENPALQAFVNWRCEQITSLVQTVKRACRCRMVVHRSGEPFWAATVWPEIAKHCDALLVKCHDKKYYEEDTYDLALTQQCQVAKEEAGSIDHVEIGLSACTPPCPNSAVLVRNMKHIEEFGVRSVSISNYGLLPISRIEWIYQATRFARRSAQQGDKDERRESRG